MQMQMQMQITTVEFQEAEAHMDTLVDAVMRGGEVVLTHCGEPVAGVHLQHVAPETPQARLRGTVAEVLDETLEYLRDPLDRPAWLLN